MKQLTDKFSALGKLIDTVGHKAWENAPLPSGIIKSIESADDTIGKNWKKTTVGTVGVWHLVKYFANTKDGQGMIQRFYAGVLEDQGLTETLLSNPNTPKLLNDAIDETTKQTAAAVPNITTPPQATVSPNKPVPGKPALHGKHPVHGKPPVHGKQPNVPGKAAPSAPGPQTPSAPNLTDQLPGGSDIAPPEAGAMPKPADFLKTIQDNPKTAGVIVVTLLAAVLVLVSARNKYMTENKDIIASWKATIDDKDVSDEVKKEAKEKLNDLTSISKICAAVVSDPLKYLNPFCEIQTKAAIEVTV